VSDPSPGAPPRSPGAFTRAFWLLCASTATVMLGVQLLTASLPLYAVRVGADDAVLGLMVGAVAGASLASRPWIGVWLDAGGAPAALLAGIALYAVAALGYWTWAAVAGLLVFRAVTGVAVALFHTAGQTLTVDLASPERLGAALSLYSLTLPVAQLIGPPVGVVVARGLGDAGLFLSVAATAAAGFALAWPLRRRAAVARTPARRLLLNRAAFSLGGWMLLLMVPFGTNVALLAVHASRRGLDNPGVVFTAMAVGLLLGLLAASRFSSRRDLRALIILGLGMAAVGMWTTAAFHGWWLVLAGGCSGLGLGVAQPLVYALVADRVPAAERGSAMATVGMFLEVGIGVGAIGGGLVARAAGLPLMFVLAGLAPALGVILVLAAARNRAYSLQ
jgi:MFS family permease